jgi:hypothetical protein
LLSQDQWDTTGKKEEEEKSDVKLPHEITQHGEKKQVN